jgi:hypothetical protein
VITYMDVLKEIHSGPIVSERNFDLKIFAPKLQEVLKAHDVKFDPAVDANLSFLIPVMPRLPSGGA